MRGHAIEGSVVGLAKLDSPRKALFLSVRRDRDCIFAYLRLVPRRKNAVVCGTGFRE